ncbi:hypothetical protein AGMMS49992_09890 [Clostridia bacterium]|nr:hypothetical protein AGMMS49992_09890 [Clostridia bacterium]
MMKRICAALIALVILLGLAVSAGAEGLILDPILMPTVDAETEADAANADLLARLAQAQATKNHGACMALLLSILRSPEVSGDMVGQVMSFAWDSDMITMEDVILLMTEVKALGRPELNEHYEDLTYILLYTGQSDEALTQLRERIAADPGDIEAATYLVFVLNMQGDYTEAAAAAEAALESISLETESSTAELLQAYAEALDGLGRYEDTVAALKEALRIARDNGDDTAYAYSLLYDAQSRAGQYKDAARSLEHALSGSQDQAMFLERARFRLWETFNPEAALRDLDALIKRDSTDFDAIHQRAFAYLWLDRFEDAAVGAEEIKAFDESLGARLAAIVTYYAGDDAEAKRLFNEFLEANPEDGIAWLYYGMLSLYSSYDMDETDRALTEAAAQLGVDADVANIRGDLLQFQGQWTAAESSYRAAWDIVEDDAGIPNNLGVFLAQQGRLEDAREVLALAQKDYPNHYWTLCLELTVEALAREYDKALAVYDSIAEQFPFMADRSLQYTRVALAALAGRTDEAATWLAALTPKVPMDRLAEAECLGLLGDYEAARRTLAETIAAILGEALTPTLEWEALVTADLVDAELALLEGDAEASLAAVRRACEQGWFPEAAKGNWVLKALVGNDGYITLLNEYPVQ